MTIKPHLDAQVSSFTHEVFSFQDVLLFLLLLGTNIFLSLSNPFTSIPQVLGILGLNDLSTKEMS
jgi:hypothetical protein